MPGMRRFTTRMLNSFVCRGLVWFSRRLKRRTIGLLLRGYLKYTLFEAAATEAKIGDQARRGKPHKQAFPEGPAVFGSVLSKCASLARVLPRIATHFVYPARNPPLQKLIQAFGRLQQTICNIPFDQLWDIPSLTQQGWSLRELSNWRTAPGWSMALRRRCAAECH